MIGVGLLIVGFFVYLIVFTPFSANRSQARLSSSLTGHPLPLYRLAAGRLPAEGKAVAVIEIPSIGVHQVVVQGTSAADLMTGPGLMPGTALPGTPGNSVVAARRVTFGGPFGQVSRLHRGSVIKVVDGAGTFIYRVSRSGTVDNGHLDVVGPTSNNELTLITSGPGLVTTGREVVHSQLVGSAVGLPNESVGIPTSELALDGDATAGGLVVLWSLLTIVTLVVAGLMIRQTRRPWLVYLFAAPIFLMFGLFACESLALALPATF